MRWLPLIAVTLAGSIASASARDAQLATLQQKLSIDRATAQRLETVADKYRGKMAPLRRADAAILGQLDTQLVISNPDPKRTKVLTAELLKNRDKLHELRNDRLHEMQKTLSPEQFARLLVSWPQLTRQLRREARRAPRR
jgi:Spy/CpxP family protein refolding chaperone